MYKLEASKKKRKSQHSHQVSFCMSRVKRDWKRRKKYHLLYYSFLFPYHRRKHKTHTNLLHSGQHPKTAGFLILPSFCLLKLAIHFLLLPESSSEDTLIVGSISTPACGITNAQAGVTGICLSSQWRLGEGSFATFFKSFLCYSCDFDSDLPLEREFPALPLFKGDFFKGIICICLFYAVPTNRTHSLNRLLETKIQHWGCQILQTLILRSPHGNEQDKDKAVMSVP